LANSSPGFERSENPGSQEQEEQTLKALGLCDINPYRVESMAVAIFPGLSLPLFIIMTSFTHRYHDSGPFHSPQALAWGTPLQNRENHLNGFQE